MHQTHGAANVYDITPLSLAAARGRHDIVEMLLEKKANLNYTSQVSELYIPTWQLQASLCRNLFSFYNSVHYQL